MKYGKIIVEKKEAATLRRLLSQAASKEDSVYSSSVAKLSQELRSADNRDVHDMPADVVRLNSMVTISTPQNINKDFQLVLPEKSNIPQNKLSILAPMGLALFGYAEGDELSWEFPSGFNSIKILKVIPPAFNNK